MSWRERHKWNEYFEWVLICLVIAVAAVLVALLIHAKQAHAATVNFAWQASAETDVAGYRLWRANTACAQAGTTAFKVIKTLTPTTFASDEVGKGTYCYRLTAFDVAGNESAPSVKRQVTIINDSAPSGFVVHSVAP